MTSFFYILRVDNALGLGLAGLHASRCFIRSGLPGPTAPRLIPFLLIFLISIFKKIMHYLCVFFQINFGFMF